MPEPIKPRTPHEIARAIVAQKPGIKGRDLFRELKAAGVNHFAAVLATRLRRTSQRSPTPKFNYPKEYTKDYDLETVLTFFNSTTYKDSERIRKKLFLETGIHLSFSQIRDIQLKYNRLKAQGFFKAVYIEDLQKFYDILPELFQTLKNRYVTEIRVRMFTIFIELLNGNVKGKRFFSENRFVKTDEFIQKLKDEFGFNNAHIKLLIKDFVDARIFQYVLSGKYLMIPVNSGK